MRRRNMSSSVVSFSFFSLPIFENMGYLYTYKHFEPTIFLFFFCSLYCTQHIHAIHACWTYMYPPVVWQLKHRYITLIEYSAQMHRKSLIIQNYNRKALVLSFSRSELYILLEWIFDPFGNCDNRVYNPLKSHFM